MKPNIQRDKYILSCILKNQQKIKKVINDFKCDFSQAPTSIIYNDYAFDLCAMYMAQIGENVKLLTENSKEALSKYINLKTLTKFRNIIDHNYEKIDKISLKAYIELMISKDILNAVKLQYQYCSINKVINEVNKEQDIEPDL